MKSLKIVVWNIGRGGEYGIETISRTLETLEPDVALISEFRTGMNGMALRARFDRMGMVYQTPCDTEPHEDALILASRLPFVHAKKHAAACNPSHLIHVLLGRHRLCAAYIPEAGDQEQVLDALARVAETTNQDSAVFIVSLPSNRQYLSGGSSGISRTHKKRLAHCGLLDAGLLTHRDKMPDEAFSADFAMVTSTLAHRVLDYRFGCAAVNNAPDRGFMLLELDLSAV